MVTQILLTVTFFFHVTNDVDTLTALEVFRSAATSGVNCNDKYNVHTQVHELSILTLSHQRTAKALASLRICADSPEPKAIT